MGHHSKRNGTSVALINITLIIGLLCSPMLRSSQAESPGRAKAKWKILHIMSYHAPWEWTDNQLNGFKDGLKDLDIEYKVLQIDAKRRNSPEWKVYIGQEAKE